jgi:hypothetical protein
MQALSTKLAQSHPGEEVLIMSEPAHGIMAFAPCGVSPLFRLLGLDLLSELPYLLFKHNVLLLELG